VGPEELRDVVKRAGFSVGDSGADIGIVVGGDGRFSRYGRTEDLPLLFVGVKSKFPTGSKAYLAEAYLDELPGVLEKIKSGNYRVQEHKRLEVLKNGRSLGEVFTDVYMERGSDSTCIRYRVKVSGEGLRFEESAIGDGVVVSTSAGSTGYFSYPDRIRGESMDPTAHAEIDGNRVGICHVAPTFTERLGGNEHPLRYTVPWGSVIVLSLFRPADTRLYGITDSRGGISISIEDRVTVRPGRKVTRVVVVES
jgi:hypothetical protein